ncbi:MAG TPA: hypothetical protein VFS55_09305 [Dokdonella sp.]|nr:hypothetical protein [Dokdonella sp.]
MRMRTLARACLVAAIACAGLSTAGPASARVVAGISIAVAPPPPRVEHVGVRVGRVWAPGYWRWNGAGHVWVGGRWIVARPGYRYSGAGWVRVGPHWRFHRGHWVRL